MAGIFCSPSIGLFSGNGFSDGVDSIGGQLGIQLTGPLPRLSIRQCLAGYWKVVDAMASLRVDQEDETAGLDIVLYDERHDL